MTNFVQFTVNDTSPTIRYSPFADTFSTPNLSAGWNPYYTLSGYVSVIGQVGDGTSLHITSNNGSSLVIQWNGTGIQLSGNATSASYSITLDGAPLTPAASPDNNVLATITSLEDAPHTVVLTALIPAVQNPPNSLLVVFESAVITSSPEPLNVSFSSQTIDDNDIAFLGRWSFDTVPTGALFHTSQTLGDRAVASFNGTTLLLKGITSPSSGNYSVTVDNMTTILSAQSSFTSYDSLLFYATELDPTSTHLVQVTNTGGSDLSLSVGGFSTFMPFSTLPLLPNQTSPTAAALTNGSYPRGTIAAFALAGILAFIILSGLIFYFLFYRRRKRRRSSLPKRRRRSLKETEAGVLHIRPEADKTAELVSPTNQDQLDTRNGFSRWKRGAVDGSPGELGLPLRFHHADSLDEKDPNLLNEAPLDDISDLSSNASAKRKAKTKSKGKARQIVGRSLSSGRMLDIPNRRTRRKSSMQQLHHQTESLDYVSTFIAAEPTSPKNAAPPSYAASVSNRDSKSTTNGKHNSDPPYDRSMPSVPHSVSLFPGDDRSYFPQKQDYTGAILLTHGQSHSEQDSSLGSSPHLLKPPQPTPLRPLRRGDQVHVVEDNADDTLPASLQQAIRSLVPRIPHPYAFQDDESIQAPSSPHDLNNAPLTNNDDLVEVRDGVFLSVSPSSPFHLNFDAPPAKNTSDKTNSVELSYMSMSSANKHPSGDSEAPNPDNGPRPMPTNSESLQGLANPRFRLTPGTMSPTSVIDLPSKSTSEGVTSFLDFSSSREGSFASRSVKTTSSEERQRGSLIPPPVEEKSRWSNTTVPTMHSKWSNNESSGNNASGNGSSDNSKRVPDPHSSVQSSTFPIPIRVSIPSSYGNDNTMVSGRRSLTSGLTQATDNLHIHPPFEGLESPTESIPMSAVSELHFRHSVSEDNVRFNSRRTTESSLVFVSSHPPLSTTRHDDFTPRPFDPSILVSRVLGLSPPLTMTAPGSGSPSPSNPAFPLNRPFASSPNLTTSQHITNLRQKSGTDPSGP